MPFSCIRSGPFSSATDFGRAATDEINHQPGRPADDKSKETPDTSQYEPHWKVRGSLAVRKHAYVWSPAFRRLKDGKEAMAAGPLATLDGRKVLRLKPGTPYLNRCESSRGLLCKPPAQSGAGETTKESPYSRYHSAAEPLIGRRSANPSGYIGCLESPGRNQEALPVAAESSAISIQPRIAPCRL
jgi:hypothetical protein